MKRFVVTIFLSITLVFFILPEAFAVSDNSEEYTITSYNIDLVVNENNTFDITENIESDFKIPKHGIFRKIPLKYEVSRLDGTTSKVLSKISNIKVDNFFTTYNEGLYKIIKIGSTIFTIKGKQKYKINYTYNIGKDKVKEKDELYFNLIGTEWDTTISNTSFKITMPKEFDETKLGFSIGEYDSIKHNYINYSVNGNIIIGSYLRTLNPGEGIDIKLELPEGYFVNASNNFSIGVLLAIIIPIIFVIICFSLWLKYGKDDIIVETVEFYPPEGYNSAEIGYLYKGKADNEDVISLLIYLANNGYIKIEELEVTKITKLKEYDGNNKNEKMFLDGLFTYENTTSTTLSNLKDKFYVYLRIIKQNLVKENKQKIFTKGKKSNIIFLMIIITALLNIKLLLEVANIAVIMFLLFITITIFIILLTPNKVKIIVTVLFLLIFLKLLEAGISIESLLYPASLLFVSKSHFLTYIIGVVSIEIMIIFIKIMPKRSIYGNQILGKIKGFKNFLEIAEKDKLEALVTKDPKYFYNILPYTYVLGVSDIWIKKFEIMALIAPEWHSGNEIFNSRKFGNFVKFTVSEASTSMSSIPRNSGGLGGGHSGRGFFGWGGGGGGGGGHGGGGGGSW